MAEAFEVKAKVRYVQISPRKVRLVLDLIRGRDVTAAFAYLNNTHRAAVPIVRTLLKSAIADNSCIFRNIQFLKI